MARPTVAAEYSAVISSATPSIPNVTIAAGQVLEVEICRNARTVTSVTWDAAGANQGLTPRGNSGTRVDKLYLLAPTPGTNKTVSCVLSNGASGMMYARVLNNVDTADPFGGQALTSIGGSGTSVNTAVASGDASDYLVTDALSVAANEATAPDASQDEIGTGANGATYSVGASQKDSTGATTTMVWTWTTSASRGYLAQAWKGAAAILPSTIASTTAVFEPIVTRGAVQVAPGLIASTAQVFAPIVASGSVALTPPSIASAAQVFAPTLAPGSVTLAPSFIATGAVVFSPAVVFGSVQIAPATITASSAVYSPTISAGVAGGQAVAASFVASGAVVFVPTAAVGSGSLLPGLIAATSIAYAPAVTTAASRALYARAYLEPTLYAGASTGPALHASAGVEAFLHASVSTQPGLYATPHSEPALHASAHIEPS